MKLPHRLIFVGIFISLFCLAAPAQQYDVLIRNGRVVDGSGNPWIYGDVGVVGDRIAFIGRAAEGISAKRTIDARGLIVAPGFIDMLGQSETSLLIDHRGFSKLTQGVTTEITGEGESIAPLNDPIIAEQRESLEHFHLTVDWRSLDGYFRRLEQEHPGLNLGTYVGATQVRKMVLGQVDRAPTSEELGRMQGLVEDAMREGALGVSSSLIYAPAFYAKTEELIALAKVASKYGGIYASHIRNEGDSEMPALDEAFRIAREANIPVEIFHLKVSGKQNWGKMRQEISAIESARANGLDITADQYPYIASATSLGALIPPKYHEGGTDAFLARLRDPAQRAAIRSDLQNTAGGFENMWLGVGGGEGVLVTSVLDPALKKYEGKRISEIAREQTQSQSKDSLDTVMDLLVAGHDNVGAVYFSMSEDDVRLAMQQPFVSVGTDYGEVAPDGPLSESKSHPRAWGSFARILGKYVRQEHVLRMEDAVRKFTSLAAQKVKLEHRGMLRPDYFADITIFDPAAVNDVATFEDPNRPSVGIEYVLVNGVLTLEHGKLTGQFGGRPLRGPAFSGRSVSPDGLPPRGRLQGVVTDEAGWPVLRARVTLNDAAGKTIGSFETKSDGHYEILCDQQCAGCKLAVEHTGFVPAQRTLNYNGANSLWFSFALKRQK